MPELPFAREALRGADAGQGQSGQVQRRIRPGFPKAKQADSVPQATTTPGVLRQFNPFPETQKLLPGRRIARVGLVCYFEPYDWWPCAGALCPGSTAHGLFIGAVSFYDDRHAG